MLARSVSRIAKIAQPAARRYTITTKYENVDGNWLRRSTPSISIDKDVVIPYLADSLEWVLSCPPSVHEFEEPPIIVEVDHLKNVQVPERVAAEDD